MTLYSYHIIILSAAISALSACTSDHTAAGEEPEPDNVPMVFSASEAKTRSLTTNENFRTSSFAVWGEITFSGSSTTVGVFDATEVRPTGTSAWSYDETRYWFPGSYKFAAIHPFAVSVSTSFSDGHLQIHNFDASSHTDMLAATASRVCNGTNTEPVALNFSHLLSSINFNASLDPNVDSDVNLSVKLFGIAKNASWNGKDYAPASENHGVWTPDNNSMTTADHPYIELNNLTIQKGATSPTSLFHDDNCLLVIPQSIPQSAIFLIEYSYADNPSAVQRYMTRLADISTPLIGGWRANRGYNYNFTIGATDYITFSKPTVVDWEDLSGGNFIIQ